jgi:hypothetical protein
MMTVFFYGVYLGPRVGYNWVLGNLSYQLLFKMGREGVLGGPYYWHDLRDI